MIINTINNKQFDMLPDYYRERFRIESQQVRIWRRIFKLSLTVEDVRFAESQIMLHIMNIHDYLDEYRDFRINGLQLSLF